MNKRNDVVIPDSPIGQKIVDCLKKLDRPPGWPAKQCGVSYAAVHKWIRSGEPMRLNQDELRLLSYFREVPAAARDAIISMTKTLADLTRQRSQHE